MTALKLALTAKRAGAQFRYIDGRLTVTDLERLPRDVRLQLTERLADVLAVVSEHNAPLGVRVTDVVDAARRIAYETRKSLAHA